MATPYNPNLPPLSPTDSLDVLRDGSYAEIQALDVDRIRKEVLADPTDYDRGVRLLAQIHERAETHPDASVRADEAMVREKLRGAIDPKLEPAYIAEKSPMDARQEQLEMQEARKEFEASWREVSQRARNESAFSAWAQETPNPRGGQTNYQLKIAELSNVLAKYPNFSSIIASDVEGLKNAIREEWEEEQEYTRQHSAAAPIGYGHLLGHNPSPDQENVTVQGRLELHKEKAEDAAIAAYNARHQHGSDDPDLHGTNARIRHYSAIGEHAAAERHHSVDYKRAKILDDIVEALENTDNFDEYAHLYDTPPVDDRIERRKADKNSVSDEEMAMTPENYIRSKLIEPYKRQVEHEYQEVDRLEQECHEHLAKWAETGEIESDFHVSRTIEELRRRVADLTGTRPNERHSKYPAWESRYEHAYGAYLELVRLKQIQLTSTVTVYPTLLKNSQVLFDDNMTNNNGRRLAPYNTDGLRGVEMEQTDGEKVIIYGNNYGRAVTKRTADGGDAYYHPNGEKVTDIDEMPHQMELPRYKGDRKVLGKLTLGRGLRAADPAQAGREFYRAMFDAKTGYSVKPDNVEACTRARDAAVQYREAIKGQLPSADPTLAQDIISSITRLEYTIGRIQAGAADEKGRAYGQALEDGSVTSRINQDREVRIFPDGSSIVLGYTQSNDVYLTNTRFDRQGKRVAVR